MSPAVLVSCQFLFPIPNLGVVDALVKASIGFGRPGLGSLTEALTAHWLEQA